MNTLTFSIFILGLQFTAFIRMYQKYILINVLFTSYVFLIIKFIPGFIRLDTFVISAIILFPYIMSANTNYTGKTKYLWLTALFIIAAYFTSVKTFYFLAVGLAILYTIESYWGNIGHLPLILLGLLSPTFKYFNNMLGYPVRLKLSEWSGEILNFMGYKAKVTGNVILLNGTEFSVDPACMGLHMMAVSLLAALLIMAFFQRQRGKFFNPLSLIAILLVIVGFNIASNLIRILLLTLFKILPENPNHEIVGLICFVIYVIAPSWFLIKWLAKIKTSSPKQLNAKPIVPKKILLLNLVLLTSLLACGLMKFNNGNIVTNNLPNITFPGYTQQIVKGDIVKLEKTGVLIYIKPLQRFYGAEHNPMICWTGSGYEFDKINKRNIGSTEIYTGTLKKGNDLIYSAWWFENGSYRTIEQTEWRWRALNGEQFNLVNINAANEKTLLSEIEFLFNQR